MDVVSDLLKAIPVYTGLSPTAFFTILAILLALFYILSDCFTPQPVAPLAVSMEPIPPPVQLGENVAQEDLLAYNGTDPKKPLLMAIKGQIYDVSQSRMFYGPGGPYASFAGRDASRALAKMSFDEKDLTGDLEGLNSEEMDTLQDWEWRFMGKYVKVGQLAKAESKSRELPLSQSSEDNPTITSDTAEEKSQLPLEDEAAEKSPADGSKLKEEE